MVILLILSFVILAVLIGGGAFIYFKVLKDMNVIEEDKSSDPNIKRTQDFLPFKDIRNSVIDMGNHYYVAVVEVSSTNYFLRNEREQEMIEMSFSRFLNSLTHRIVIYIKTKEIDFDLILDSLKKDSLEVCNINPNLNRLAELNYQATSQLASYVQDGKQKKKYIIIPFQEAALLEDLEEKEKKEYSLTELDTRVNIILSNLLPMDIKGERLNTEKIIELIYTSYNRDANSKDYKHIFTGEYTKLFVDGHNPNDGKNPRDFVDHALYEAQMRIKNEAPNNFEVAQEFNELIKSIEQMRIQIKDGGKENEAV